MPLITIRGGGMGGDRVPCGAVPLCLTLRANPSPLLVSSTAGMLLHCSADWISPHTHTHTHTLTHTHTVLSLVTCSALLGTNQLLLLEVCLLLDCWVPPPL